MLNQIHATRIASREHAGWSSTRRRTQTSAMVGRIPSSTAAASRYTPAHGDGALRARTAKDAPRALGSRADFAARSRQIAVLAYCALSLQATHLHLIVEADSANALGLLLRNLGGQ